MRLFSWLNSWTGFDLSGRARPTGSGRKTAPRRQLTLETLEDRCLLSFGNPISIAAIHPIALATADVNGDHLSDLITLNNSNTIQVLLSKGNGKFTNVGGYFVGSGADILQTVAVGDLNGDGKPDIITGNNPGDGGSFGEHGSFSVLLGNGNGTFQPAQTYHDVLSLYGGPTSVAVADFNGDGKNDLAFSSMYESNVDIVMNFGNGDFSYSTVQTYSVGYETGQGNGTVTPGDFNRDGRIDLFASSGYVLLNNGGTFTPSVASPPAASAAVGDVNGDGKLDLVTTSFGNNVSVFLGNGNGTFGAAQTYAVGGTASSVALGDFNGDGKLDIATTGTEMDVLLNNGDGTFGTAQKVGPAGRNLVVADFNGDGFADLAQIDASGASIDVLLNGGATTTGNKGHK